MYGDTRLSVTTYLEEYGVSYGPLQERLLAADAPRRHQARVAAVGRICDEAAYKVTAVTSPEFLAVQCLLVSADIVGVGGSFVNPGAATDRLPLFSALGKGRKQARDGGAWDAAILAAGEAAYKRLLDAGARARLTVREGSLCLLVVTEDSQSCLAIQHLLPREWALNLIFVITARFLDLGKFLPRVFVEVAREDIPALNEWYSTAAAETEVSG